MMPSERPAAWPEATWNTEPLGPLQSARVSSEEAMVRRPLGLKLQALGYCVGRAPATAGRTKPTTITSIAAPASLPRARLAVWTRARAPRVMSVPFAGSPVGRIVRRRAYYEVLETALT